jgi:hypothetical protein
VEVGMDKEKWTEFYGDTLFKKTDARIEEPELIN